MSKPLRDGTHGAATGADATEASSDPRYVADESTLRTAAALLVRHWQWITGAALLGGTLAFAASFLIDPVYRSEVRISVVMDFDRASGAAFGGALGGLASLAGIQTQASSERVESLAVLASRALGDEFLVKENLMPGLFPDRWDTARNAWFPSNDRGAPTIREAFTAFSQEVRIIEEDPRTGLVIVSMVWSNPEEAAELANRYVSLANATLRERAIEEAKASIEFLDMELGKTQSIPVQEAIYRLIEQQTKRIMLANVRRDYAFKVIDPAVAPDHDDVDRPRRLLMTSVGILLGLTLGVLVGFLRGNR